MIGLPVQRIVEIPCKDARGTISRNSLYNKPIAIPTQADLAPQNAGELVVPSLCDPGEAAMQLMELNSFNHMTASKPQYRPQFARTRVTQDCVKGAANPTP